MSLPRLSRNTLSPTALLTLCGLYMSCLLSVALWRRVVASIASDAAGSWLLTAQIVAFVVFLTLAVLAVFRLPFVLKPVLAFLVVASAISAYFMNSYGVMIDDDMLRNAMQTDSRETAGLMTVRFFAYAILLGFVPAWWVLRTQVRWGTPFLEIPKAAAWAVLFLALSLGSAFVDYKAAAPFLRINGKEMRWRAAPINLIMAGYYIARDSRAASSPTKFTAIADRATLAKDLPAGKRNLVVLVVGETSRAMNFSLNGYDRATNPLLSSRPVTSFAKVSSCGTSTAISLPCMFSNLNRTEYGPGKADNRENLLDLAKRAGYRVVWIDNQAGSKGVADRVEFRQLEGPIGAGDEISDISFVPEFKSMLALSDEHLLVVMHQMGSHGPEYFRRSIGEAKRFLPECREKQLERCAIEEIRNGYDNTISQTDTLLAGLIDTAIEQAADRAVTLLYVSDHGESLGENGLYLHGLPYALAPETQTHVPLIFWTNAGAELMTGVARTCAADLREQPLSHDNYFHSVLGLLRIDSDAYDRTLDAFAGCRAPQSAPDR